MSENSKETHKLKNVSIEQQPTDVEKFLFGFLQSLIREHVLEEKGVS